MNTSPSSVIQRSATYYLAWCIITCTVLLPSMSHMGYSPISLEYLTAVIISSVFGSALGRVAACHRYLAALCLLLMVSTTVAFYFSKVLWWGPSWMMYGAAVLLAGFFLLGACSFHNALKLAAFVSLAQIAVSAYATTPLTHYLKENPEVRHSESPPVIHLLLDEHAATGAIPPEAVSAEDVAAFENEYVKHGFIVFRRAYTFEGYTHFTLARIFNEKLKNVMSTIDNRWRIKSASRFDHIGTQRALDVTQLSYVDFSQAFANNPAVARYYWYDENIPYPAYEGVTVPASDRLLIAAAKFLDWSRYAVQFDPINRLIKSTEFGWRLAYDTEILARPHALVSRFVLKQLTERLQCCGTRGTYYFAHLLLPHFPYMFDKNCYMLPALHWQHRIIFYEGDTNTEESRIEKYRMHFAQASCLQKDIVHLSDTLLHTESMKDAVLFIHGDHGSRIAIQEDKSSPDVALRRRYKRDWFGTFAAVRIPGVPGRVVDQPVYLINLYEALLDNDFKSLDVNAIKPTARSPY